MIPFDKLTIQDMESLSNDELMELLRQRKVNGLQVNAEGEGECTNGCTKYVPTTAGPSSSLYGDCTYLREEKRVTEKDISQGPAIAKSVSQALHPNTHLTIDKDVEEFMGDCLTNEQVQSLGYDMWSKLEVLRCIAYKGIEYVLLLNSQRLYVYGVIEDVIGLTYEVDRRNFIPCNR